MNRSYGWKKQDKDDRDLQYGLTASTGSVPFSSDLRNMFPDCWDQSQTNSCTGYGIASALYAAMVRADQPPFMPSPFFIYWNERKLEEDTMQDGGGMIRDGIKGCNKFGFVSESLWISHPDNVLKEPSAEAYTHALPDRIRFYAAVDLTNLDVICRTLTHNIPIVFGFDVYEYFESKEMAQTGILKLPEKGEAFLGGHCTVIVGHNDKERMFLIRNSYGNGWGLNGYFKMPYDYFTSNYCSDGWVIRLR